MRPGITTAAALVSGGSTHVPARSNRTLGTATVVIPCYRYGHYLGAAVRAALDQPRVDVDVVIVDDASPDGSGEVAEQIAASEQRVQVIRHPRNQGHIATYNDGLDAASGDLVALVSADDLLTRGSVTRAAELLSARPEVGFVYGRAKRFMGEVPMVATRTRHWITWPGRAWVAARCRAGHNVIASPEVVMRRSVQQQAGPYDASLPHSGDLEMWLRAALLADVGFVVGPDQALYREHAENMHRTVFGSGRAEGQLIDLQQRWEAFSLALNAPWDTNKDSLLDAAGRTLAQEAKDHVVYAAARGHEDYPAAAFRDFAQIVDPDRFDRRSWNALLSFSDCRTASALRWVPRGAMLRANGALIRRRIAWVGV